MHDEVKKMRIEIQKYSIILCIITILITMITPFFSKEVIIGYIVGMICGLIGFSLIERMSATIEYSNNPKGKGIVSYYLRYLIYIIIFVIFAMNKVPLLALFIGMLCHKSALFLYAFMHRKED